MAANARFRRNFPERKDCMREYNDAKLIRRFRFDTAGINFLESLVALDIRSGSARNRAMTPNQKLMVTLRFLATGKMQLCNADDMGISQSSVSRAITSTIKCLSSPRIVRQFVKFPTQPQEIRQNEVQFHRIDGFPGVVGVIDGTHVQIIAPKENENEYVNRHHYHSINVQVVFDANYKIIDVVAKWPGSTHDSRILNESGLRVLFENNHLSTPTHLLGDSGYPSRRWLLTPFLRPLPGAQTNYNRAHKCTRSVVERGIGQLKRRFHVLHGEVRLSPHKVCQVIIACAVLHNICKDQQIPIPDDNDGDNDDNSDEDNDSDDGNANRLHQTVGIPNGNLYRQQFATNHFSH